MRLTLISLIALFIFGCTSSLEEELERAHSLREKKDFTQALSVYDKIIKQKPNSKLAASAAIHAAKISRDEKQNYTQAIKYYEYVILLSENPSAREMAQISIADLYFDKLNDFHKSIEAYNKLLQTTTNDTKKVKYRLALARSNFSLNNFYQALIEVDNLLDMNLDQKTLYEVLVFKGNILLTTKKIEDAISIYKQVIEEFPEQSRKDNITMNLALCYEELNDFDEAIKILEELKKDYPMPDFIEITIKKLKKRKENLPGARGLRR